LKEHSDLSGKLVDNFVDESLLFNKLGKGEEASRGVLDEAVYEPVTEEGKDTESILKQAQ